MPWGDGMAMAGSFPSRRDVNGAVSGQPIAEPENSSCSGILGLRDDSFMRLLWLSFMELVVP